MLTDVAMRHRSMSLSLLEVRLLRRSVRLRKPCRSGAMAKIYAGEVATQCVYDCMRVMGVNSYDRRSHPIEKYMRDVLCFPIYDAGNMGMQRRKIWGVMAHPNFNPRAFMDNDAIHFSKDMEGIGSVVDEARRVATQDTTCGPGQTGRGRAATSPFGGFAMPVRETFGLVPPGSELGALPALRAVCAAFLRRPVSAIAGVGLGRAIADGPAARPGPAAASSATPCCSAAWRAARVAGRMLAIFFGFLVLLAATTTVAIDWDIARPLGWRVLAGARYLVFRGLRRCARARFRRRSARGIRLAPGEVLADRARPAPHPNPVPRPSRRAALHGAHRLPARKPAPGDQPRSVGRLVVRRRASRLGAAAARRRQHRPAILRRAVVEPCGRRILPDRIAALHRVHARRDGAAQPDGAARRAADRR